MSSGLVVLMIVGMAFLIVFTIILIWLLLLPFGVWIIDWIRHHWWARFKVMQ